MPTTLHVSRLAESIGEKLGASAWLTVDQAMIDAFAQVTRDDQWIHTDPARAAEGPYGTTVAHGLLTLSLLPALAAEVYRIEGARGRINYGYDRVRFPEPVPAGSRIRDVVRLDDVVTTPGGIRLHLTHTVEIDGAPRPACVASGLTHLVVGEDR